MSDLTADRAEGVPAHKQVIGGAHFLQLPVAASTVIYKGGFVGVNASGDLVMYVAPVPAATQVGNRYIGIAQEHIASQSAAGDAKCSVQVSGFVVYDLSAVSKADVGKPVFVSEDNTISIAASGNPLFGWITDLDSSGNAQIKMPGFWNTDTPLFTRVSGLFDVASANERALLVHESENHNGIIPVFLAAIVTTQLDLETTDSVISLVHTTATDTTMGAIITTVDNLPANDLLVSAANTVLQGADNNPLIPAPADKAIIAKLTTLGTGASAAGVVRVIFQGIAL